MKELSALGNNRTKLRLFFSKAGFVAWSFSARTASARRARLWRRRSDSLHRWRRTRRPPRVLTFAEFHRHRRSLWPFSDPRTTVFALARERKLTINSDFITVVQPRDQIQCTLGEMKEHFGCIEWCIYPKQGLWELSNAERHLYLPLTRIQNVKQCSRRGLIWILASSSSGSAQPEKRPIAGCSDRLYLWQIASFLVSISSQSNKQIAGIRCGRIPARKQSFPPCGSSFLKEDSVRCARLKTKRIQSSQKSRGVPWRKFCRVPEQRKCRETILLSVSFPSRFSFSLPMWEMATFQYFVCFWQFNEWSVCSTHSRWANCEYFFEWKQTD